MEGAPEHSKKIIEHKEEIVKGTGESGRMPETERDRYRRMHGGALHINTDFVSIDTYRSIFSSLDLQGKTIINVGAGSAMGESDTDRSPIIEALNVVGKDTVCIPIDYHHIRSKSWNLIDTPPSSSEDDGIVFEPVTTDAIKLPLSDASIDGYLSTNLINEPRLEESEVAFVKALFTEAYRVVKPGGFLMVSSFGYFWWKTKEGEVIYNDSIDIEEIVTAKQVEQYIREAGFSHLESIPLDPKEIKRAIQERRDRKQDATEAGVVEACAFFARK